MTAKADAAAEAVAAFFAQHQVASLRLPSGWFGRPHDNFHQLATAAVEGDAVLIRLDRTQVLTLDAETAAAEGRILRVTIQGGLWRWTEYGGNKVHREILGSGIVEFHAPFDP